MKTALKALGVAAIVVLLLVIASAAALGISARRSGDAIPTIAGYKVLAVISGSMEPSILTGDMIVVKPLTNVAEEVQDGDVITFRAKEKPDMLITHRVVGTVKVGGRPIAFGTKGDNNEVLDREVVTPEQIIGRYAWRIPYFGYMQSFIRTPLGIALLVVLPGAIIIGLELRKMLK